MTEEMLLRATIDEHHRQQAATADARAARGLPPLASPRTSAQPGHAAGWWCWLLDLLPPRARRHLSA